MTVRSVAKIMGIKLIINIGMYYRDTAFTMEYVQEVKKYIDEDLIFAIEVRVYLACSNHTKS
jgi:hypothetical protein